MSNKKFIAEYCNKAKSAIACLLILGLQWVVGNAYSASILGANPENSMPVHSSQGAVPMVLLTVARDHSLFFPAYNDMTDLNGDGKVDGVDIYDENGNVVKRGYDTNGDMKVDRWESIDSNTGLPIVVASDESFELR